eukprot:gene30858-35903_t
MRSNALHQHARGLRIGCSHRELRGLTSKPLACPSTTPLIRRMLGSGSAARRGMAASRLIVTVLCTRFVPVIVLYEREVGQFEVLDGKQRLITLLSFWKGATEQSPELKAKGIEHKPALTKLEEDYEDLEGLSFNDLSKKHQFQFTGYSLTYVTIPYGTPMSDVLAVYKDINRGGLDQNAQQARKAVYAHSNELMIGLEDMAANADFRHCYRPKHTEDNYEEEKSVREELDCELILRTLAFSLKWTRFKPSVSKFIERVLEDFQALDNEILKQKHEDTVSEMKQQFAQVVKVERELFEGYAYRRWERSKGVWGWSKEINPHVMALKFTLFIDLKGRRFHGVKAVLLLQRKDALVKVTQRLFEDEGLGEFTGLTGKKFGEKLRLLEEAYMACLDEGDPIPTIRKMQANGFLTNSFARTSSRSKVGGRCGICKQTIDPKRIEDIEFVSLDHINPHSKGGPTELGNCQLVHKRCNSKKGNRTRAIAGAQGLHLMEGKKGQIVHGRHTPWKGYWPSKCTRPEACGRAINPASAQALQLVERL